MIAACIVILAILAKVQGVLPGPFDVNVREVVDPSRSDVNLIIVSNEYPNWVHWYSALNRCQSYYDGHLAMIMSIDATETLLPFLSELNCEYAWLGFTQTGYPRSEPDVGWCWLGSMCESDSFNYYTNWAQSEPSNCLDPNEGVCQCAVMDVFGVWSDKDCYDFAQMNCFVCESKCPEGFYKNTLTGSCDEQCPGEAAWIPDPVNRICYAECPFFYHPAQEICVSECSYELDGLIEFPDIKQCVHECPEYRNPVTNRCVNQCPAEDGLFKDPITKTCVSECPNYRNAATNFCVDQCLESEGLHGDPLTKLCVTDCPFAVDVESNLCISRCPDDRFLNLRIGECSKDCSSGYYKVNATKTCSECPEGKYSRLGSNLFCDTCPQGFAPNDDKSDCVPCAAGKYGSAEDLGTCKLCAAGYGSQEGSSSCYACSPGTSALPGTGCIACPPGKYSDKVGASICSSCVGTSNSSLLSSGSRSLKECTSCIDGYYRQIQSQSGSNDCAKCGPGSYRNQESSSLFQCELCPPGRFSGEFGLKQASDCSLCPTGTWSDNYGETSVESCKSCPESVGLACPEGSSVPYVYFGYFRSPLQPDLVFKCIPEDACPESAFNATSCAEGYTGDRCAECVSDQYYRKDRYCYKCGSQWFKWLLFAAFIAILSFLMWFSTISSTSFISRVRMSIYSFQILGSFARISENFPVYLRTFLGVVTLTNFDVQTLSLECDSIPLTYWSVWYFKLLLPFITATCLGGNYFIVRLRSKSAKAIESTFNRSIYILVSLVNLMYILIFISLLEPFQCVRQKNGSYSMIANPSVRCYDETWRTNVLPAVVIFGTLYVIVLPSIVGHFFWKYRFVIYSENFQRFFGALTKSYREEVYWYEFVVFMKKLSIIVLPDVLSSMISENSRVLVCSTALIFFVVVDSAVFPYKDKPLNDLNITWSCIHIFLLMISLVTDNRSGATRIETRILTTAAFILIAFALVSTFSRLVRKYDVVSRLSIAVVGVSKPKSKANEV